MSYTYATVCSGIEGCTLALEAAPPTKGTWSPLFFSEVAPFPCAVLAHRWPDVPNLGDMAAITLKNGVLHGRTGTLPFHGPLHLLAGGTPCQDFSVAGRRAGAEQGSGTRSSLCWEWLRLVAELAPRTVLWENVPGALSTHNGADFSRFVATLSDIGYGVAWRVLDCQYTRVDCWPLAIPQRRRRLWLVGVADGDVEGAASILFEPPRLLGRAHPLRAEGTPASARPGADPAPSGVYNFELTSHHPLISACRVRDNLVYPALTGATQQLTNAEIECGGLILDPGHCRAQSVVGTITGNHESRITDATNVVHAARRVRRLTPEECERLMGYPEGYTRVPYRGRPAEACPDGPRYEACGNGWAINCARWVLLGIHKYLSEKGD